MIQQILRILPHGLLQSGQVGIVIDPSSGLIEESHSVVAGIYFFTKTFAGSNSFKIDPSYLLSKSIVVGLSISISPVTITVKSVNPGVAATLDVNVNAPGTVLSGTAILDLSKDEIAIAHVDLTGITQSESVEIELAP